MNIDFKFIKNFLLSKYHISQAKRHEYRKLLLPQETPSIRLCTDNVAKRFSGKINSKNYWDYRFKQGDWSEKNGEMQTIDHLIASLSFIPDKIKSDIKELNTIVDYGCALGEGSKILKDEFPEQRIVGCDISSDAIEIAKKKFSNIQFINSSTFSEYAPYDVFYSSNTFEHIKRPFEELMRLSKFIKKYIIIVVPYNEIELFLEHVSSFSESNLPNMLGNFKLIFNHHYSMQKTLGIRAKYYFNFDYEQFIFIYKKQ